MPMALTWIRSDNPFSSARARVRSGLVMAEVALAVVLVVGAGLLIRSFAELTHVRLGFDPDHVLTAQVRVSGERRSEA